MSIYQGWTQGMVEEHNKRVKPKGWVACDGLVVPVVPKVEKDNPFWPKLKAGKVITCEEDRLNKTERRFHDILRQRFSFHGTTRLYIQTFTLRLSDRCRYTPDITIVWESGNVHHFEIKGPFIWSKAMNKPKMAANKFPQHFFYLAQWKEGKWTETRIEP